MVHRNVDDYVGAFSYHPTHFIIQTMKCYIRNFSLVRAVNVNAVGVLTKNYKDYPTRFIIQTMKYYPVMKNYFLWPLRMVENTFDGNSTNQTAFASFITSYGQEQRI